MTSSRASVAALVGLTLLLVPVVSVAIGAPARQAAALTVPATANIFGSGQSSPPAPAGGGGGTAPVAYSLPANAGLVTFAGGSGSVTCCGGFSTPPFNGPAGGTPLSPGSTDIPAVGGISGVYVSNRQMFLAGVFLAGGPPSGSPPRTSTLTQVPALQQVFYVGAGSRTVGVPEGATRLFLGFADAFGFRGQAGYYSDNRGSVRIDLTVAQKPPPIPASRLAWPALPDALVPIGSVSNGCGGGEASAKWKFGDTSTYADSNVNATARSYTVNFREACKLHDAGYSGAKVRDALYGGVVVDFFSWTKERVDKKFLADMILICERTIPASAATALANCKATGGNFSAGARSRFNFVDRFGSLFWKDRPNVRGLWAVKGDAAAPPWAIVQKMRNIKAVWRGGTGQPNLRGEFRGTLISRDQDTVIRGFAQITRNGETTIGAMSLLFYPGTVFADRVVVLGPGMRATLKR